MEKASSKDKIAVSIDVVTRILVLMEGPVRRFVTPRLSGSTALALIITLVSGARKLNSPEVAKTW